MSNLRASEGKPTARRGLRSENNSPSLTETPPETQRRLREGASPRRRNITDTKEWPDDNHISDNELDVVDRATQRESPSLYPNLDELNKTEVESDSSPGYDSSKTRKVTSLDDSSAFARSRCSSKTGPGGPRTGPSTDPPVTPERRSPGRRIHDIPDEVPNRPRRGMMPILAIGFLLLIIFCILSLRQSLQNVEELSEPKPKIKSLDDIYKDIKRELRNIHSQFSQPKHFWIQLIGQLDTIMVEDPIQPAVILAVVPEGADKSAVCLLHHICHAVSNSFEGESFVLYDVKSEIHKGSSELKYDLHQQLERLGQSHAAIVHNVEKIPGSAAMTFHGFCDNENAPHKQALIFLALSLPLKYEDLSEQRLANTIDDYLLSLWGEELLQKDVSAVVSRVANAPVLIKPEDESILETACANI